MTQQQKPDIVVDPPSISDDEWNEKYQRVTLMEENSLEESVQKGLTISSLVGSFLHSASHISQLIVYEYALRSSLQTVRKIPLRDENGVTSSEEIFCHKGLLFRLCQQPTTDEDTGPSEERRRALAIADTIQHKVAGHELRSTNWVQQAATAMYKNQVSHTPPAIFSKATN